MSRPANSNLFAQLPLGVRLRAGAAFANYHSGPNRQALALVQQAVTAGDEPCLYLWGGAGTGKTHLLQAACHVIAARAAPVAYLPFAEAAHFTPALLDGLEQLSWVVLDDLDHIAGDAAWETALFHLYNRVREAGGHLLMAARGNPASLPLSLPDLRSRLAWSLVLQLHELSDDDKAEALRIQARQRGMEMPVEVAVFLLRRCRREMHALFELLELLDHASLAAQRKLTVPFVKSVLDAPPA
ncbi:MAG: DnaA regulatory inactivator Hda [Pseudomonadota bacterium]